MPPSPALYVRQTDEESGGGGSGRRASGDGSSGDWFDIPPKNASVERLRRWRVCFLDPVAGFLMSGCLRAMVGVVFGSEYDIAHIAEEEMKFFVSICTAQYGRALKKVGMTVEVLHLLLFWLLWSQIPADGVVITGHSLAIDESSMTGESKIVSAAEIVLASCTSWLDADGSKQPLTSDKDPCRPGVKAAVDLCTKAGVKLSVLNIITLPVNGYYLNLISLQVMGRSSPSDKLLLVQALRKRGHVVAVTGDGTNDAPALHEVCIHVSEVLSLCCSTLTEKISLFFFLFPFSFTLLYQVVRWGRSVYANIQKFIQFQLTVNVAALIINVVAAVSSGNVPLNAVQVG
ncbi:hypothetical protein BHE74_00010314 [Ensete ventricosum]|uniref:Uncharacterized protein n=1 Tax=Ensete ventricosum TaxID=4639 RepID=A0A445MER8_ENSVE|nr:hypothetical protein BHE74_00010314 [Ensete ventricosum]RZR72760.1 hypothetical protein BHM03_00016844 [Ensete ventricosum]